ncbi:hypothetical protein HY251_16460 [bacterium]|nr:hypothetical protein [bacterium]
MNDPESWLRRFRPRGPRPELREAILARAAEEPERPDPLPRRWPWLDRLALLALVASFAVSVAAEASSRDLLHRETGPAPRTRAEREAEELVRSQDTLGVYESERLVAMLAPRPRAAFSRAALDDARAR